MGGGRGAAPQWEGVKDAKCAPDHTAFLGPMSLLGNGLCLLPEDCSLLGVRSGDSPWTDPSLSRRQPLLPLPSCSRKGGLRSRQETWKCEHRKMQTT